MNLNRLTRGFAATAIVASALAAGVLHAAPASAQGGAQLIINGRSDTVELTGNGPWTVKVSGANFRVPKTAPAGGGGVYVLFGMIKPIDGQWGPSTRNGIDGRGISGVTYAYTGNADFVTRSDDGSGLTRFVAFYDRAPDATATDFFMTTGADVDATTRFGSFGKGRGGQDLTLRIESPVFTYQDPRGPQVTVDCRDPKNVCGVFTIGGHGVPSASNERFVRITFKAASGGGSTGGGTPAPAPGGGSKGGSTGGSAGGSNGQLTPEQLRFLQELARQQAGGTNGGPRPAPTPQGNGEPGKGQQTDRGGRSAEDGSATSAAPSTSVAVETTMNEESGTTTTGPSTSTSKPQDTEDREDAEVAVGADVVTVESTDDSGSAVLVWGLGIGIPVAAAAGVLVWRRRTAAGS